MATPSGPVKVQSSERNCQPFKLIYGAVAWDVTLSARACPSQHGLDAGDELARGKRFDQIIVGAHLQSDDAIGFLCDRAVNRMIGNSPCSRSERQRLRPSSPGIMISRTSKSMALRPSVLRASAAFAAVDVRNPDALEILGSKDHGSRVHRPQATDEVGLTSHLLSLIRAGIRCRLPKYAPMQASELTPVSRADRSPQSSSKRQDGALQLGEARRLAFAHGGGGE